MLKPFFTTLPTGNIVLASASVTRARLLEDAGLGFFKYPVVIDEEAVRAAGIVEDIPASNIAVTLAEMKATAATQRLAMEHLTPPVYVLGCDQILACDGKIYNKPNDIPTARSQLLALAGKTHQLHTAVVLFQHGRRIWHHISVADMTMREFDNQFVDAYLRELGDAAYFSPASYQIESIGAHLFLQIKGCHYSILGIPLLEVLAILREHGLFPTQNKSKSKFRGGS